MFIEHIDQLRCTTDHEESWLVASIVKREDRFILTGTLGCHICQRQYPVIGGVAYFGMTPPDQRRVLVQDVSGDANKDTNEDALVRVAAFLNAMERSTLVLGGSWGAQAHPLSGMLPLTVFALAPGTMVQESAHVAHIESSEGIPLTRASVDGVALDELTATPQNVAGALRVLKPGGRFVAPNTVGLPIGVMELARDDAYWVGEMQREVVPLRRA